jgi:hypothetical protein
MRRFLTLAIGVAALKASFVLSAETTSPPNPRRGVQITQEEDRLRVEINGQLFTEYHFKNTPRPYCYPLIGPGELPMTRNFPMKSPPNEEHDHPHHRSLWFGHILVNGQDFWTEAKSFGKIVHDGFDEVKSGIDSGLIKARDKWVGTNGEVVCTDERTLRIFNPASDAERLFDFQVIIHASNGDVVFGDNKDGTMAVRLAETMRLKGEIGHGHIVNSVGQKDDETWGKRADWCDYYGPVEGKTVGIAIFDHPQNLRHPTWWHVRDYGLFAANPFGRHDFEKLKDKSAGNFTLPSGKSLTLRYRFYMHEGDEQQAKVAEHYQEYIKSSAAKL